MDTSDEIRLLTMLNQIANAVGTRNLRPHDQNTKNPTQQHLKAIWQRSYCLSNYL